MPRKAETRVRCNPEVDIWERTESVADETTERPVHEERRKVMTQSTLYVSSSSSHNAFPDDEHILYEVRKCVQ